MMRFRYGMYTTWPFRSGLSPRWIEGTDTGDIFRSSDLMEFEQIPSDAPPYFVSTGVRLTLRGCLG